MLWVLMGTHDICLYEVDKKIMELFDCALIQVCGVIRSITVFGIDRFQQTDQTSI